VCKIKNEQNPKIWSSIAWRALLFLVFASCRDSSLVLGACTAETQIPQFLSLSILGVFPDLFRRKIQIEKGKINQTVKTDRLEEGGEVQDER
jgi:hypothetical protein